MQLELRTPDDSEFRKIQSYIHDFELDNRVLQANEFIGAFRNGELVGFGRLRKHPDCLELCSLGVVTFHRRKGIGKALVQALIQKSDQPLYLVCIIPNFFAPFGFKVVSIYPEAMTDKLNYCTEELVVPEKYVVMHYQPDLA